MRETEESLPLSASRVPDLKRDKLLADLQVFHQEISANGGFEVGAECLVHIPIQQRCFTHTCVPQKNNLK